MSKRATSPTARSIISAVIRVPLGYWYASLRTSCAAARRFPSQRSVRRFTASPSALNSCRARRSRNHRGNSFTVTAAHSTTCAAAESFLYQASFFTVQSEGIETMTMVSSRGADARAVSASAPFVPTRKEASLSSTMRFSAKRLIEVQASRT